MVCASRNISRIALLRHHDGVLAVRRVVHVVGVVDADGLALFAGGRVDRVRLLPLSLSTHSVFRSYEGVTCCGWRPTVKVSMTLYVAGSITVTVLLSVFGT